MSKISKVLFALALAFVASLLFVGCVTEAESQVIMGEAVENANQDPALDAVEPEGSDAQVPVRRGAKSPLPQPEAAEDPTVVEESAPETVEEPESETRPAEGNDDKWVELKILPRVIKKLSEQGEPSETDAVAPESPPEEGAKVKTEHEDVISRLLASGIDTLESAPMPEPIAPLAMTTDVQEERQIEDEQVLPAEFTDFYRAMNNGEVRVDSYVILDEAVEKYPAYKKFIDDNQKTLGYNTGDIKRLADAERAGEVEPRMALVDYSGAKVTSENLSKYMLSAEYNAFLADKGQGVEGPTIPAPNDVFNTRSRGGKLGFYTDSGRNLVRYALMITDNSGAFTSCGNPFVIKPEPPPEPVFHTLTIVKKTMGDITGISAEEVFGITVPHGLTGIPEEYSIGWQEGNNKVVITLPHNAWYSVNETWMPSIWKFDHYSGDAPQGHITKDIVVEIWNRRMLPDEPPVVVVPPHWQIIKKIRVVKDGVELPESSPEFQAAAKETFRVIYSVSGVYGVATLQYGVPFVLKGVPGNGVGLMNYSEELTSSQIVAGWQNPPLDPVADLKARTTTYTNTLILTTPEPELEYGSVIVDKNLSGWTAKTDMDAVFAFTANVYRASGELIRTDKFSLGIREGVNDTHEINYVPYGGFVAVEEHLTMPEGFSPDVVLQHTVSVTAAIPRPVISVTNHWTDPVVAVGSIELGKIARSAALNVPHSCAMAVASSAITFFASF